MSYFGSALETALKRKQMKAKELSQITGLQEAKLSRLIRGVQTFISADDLKLICVALGPVEASDVVRAHLKDECPEPYRYLLAEQAYSAAVMQETTSGLPATKLDEAFDLLRANASDDPDLRSLILDLARLFRSKK